MDITTLYLSLRRRYVNYTSELHVLPVLSDVPQGSVLGPILFVNDLPDSVISSKVTLFIDDTNAFNEQKMCCDVFFSFFNQQYPCN